MPLRLLNNAPANTTGDPIVVRSVVDAVPLLNARVTVLGNYAGESVYIEHSPDSGANWIQIAAVPAGGGDITITSACDWLRARTGALASGTATVYLEPSS